MLFPDLVRMNFGKVTELLIYKTNCGIVEKRNELDWNWLTRKVSEGHF